MKTQAHNKQEQLFEIAETQQGFFTAKQAAEAGFIKTNHSYHVKIGSWIREGRGIYRLRNFPATPASQLIAHALWTRNRQDDPEGVYSHETALAIHELSDVMPAKLHMTVPTTFRRFAKPPKILTLHFANLDQTDIEEKRGFKVTRPIKTILDLMASESVSHDIIEQAFAEGVIRGMISQKDIHSKPIPQDIKATLEKWLKRIRQTQSRRTG